MIKNYYNQAKHVIDHEYPNTMGVDGMQVTPDQEEETDEWNIVVRKDKSIRNTGNMMLYSLNAKKTERNNKIISNIDKKELKSRTARGKQEEKTHPKK
jgi:hypothetical protein